MLLSLSSFFSQEMYVTKSKKYLNPQEALIQKQVSDVDFHKGEETLPKSCKTVRTICAGVSIELFLTR